MVVDNLNLRDYLDPGSPTTSGKYARQIGSSPQVGVKIKNV